jgi:hypothetical protein
MRIVSRKSQESVVGGSSGGFERVLNVFADCKKERKRRFWA